MKMHLDSENIIEWVESTIDEIEELLKKENIPYQHSWTKDGLDHGIFFIKQLTFPWHIGDVVVGTLHAFDDDVIHGIAELRYPSIETYHFPWDDDDITVFDTPEQFVAKLKNLYNSFYRGKSN